MVRDKLLSRYDVTGGMMQILVVKRFIPFLYFWPAAGIESSRFVQHRKSAIHGLLVRFGKSDWLRIWNEYSELSIAGARRRRSGWSWALGTRMCVGWVVSVTKFEMAKGWRLKARKELHFIKFTPPFSTVGSFSELRFRGALSNDTSIDVSKKQKTFF